MGSGPALRCAINEMSPLFGRIEPKKDAFRRLTPIELERLNGFPPNWTDVGKVSDSRRGFLMGNALVIGIVRKLAVPLADVLHRRPSS